MKTKAKSGINLYQKGLLVGGGIVLVGVGLVSAVSSYSTTPVGINEVREVGVRELTLSGLISREPGKMNEKDKYIITTGSGTKYLLIGMKQAYTVKGMEKKNTKPRPESKNDSDDRVAFEEFVGKRVTMVGFVVPVESKPEAEKEMPNNNGKKQAVKPMVKPSVKPETSPKGGQLFDRFVVKEITLAE